MTLDALLLIDAVMKYLTVRFYFENGNTLVITLANYQAFAETWLPFRQSFFAV